MMMKSLVAMRSSTSHCRVYFYSNAIGFKDMMMRGLALRRRVFFVPMLQVIQAHINEEVNYSLLCFFLFK
jgi:hypothetical protein